MSEEMHTGKWKGRIMVSSMWMKQRRNMGTKLKETKMSALSMVHRSLQSYTVNFCTNNYTIVTVVYHTIYELNITELV